MSDDDPATPLHTAPPRSAGPADADPYFDELYGHLRRLARSYLRRERPGHTLQPTALVHEIYLRLHGVVDEDLQDRGRFLALAARAMRRVLIDNARRQAANKRRHHDITLGDHLLGDEPRPIDALVLNEALDALAAIDEQRARIVEMRFFAGLSCEEVAEVLDVSARTVVRQWRSSRAFLLRRLGASPTTGVEP